MDEHEKLKLRDSLDALKRALAPKERGKRGPHGEQGLVELKAGDVVRICETIPAADRTRTIDDLHKGAAAGRPERRINQQVDDLYHMVETHEKAIKARPEAETAKPKKAGT